MLVVSKLVDVPDSELGNKRDRLNFSHTGKGLGGGGEKGMKK